MEIRSHWRRRQQEPRDEKDSDFDEIDVVDEQEIGDCDCDGCEVSYISKEEEEEEKEEKRPLDRESFSNFLMGVPCYQVVFSTSLLMQHSLSDTSYQGN